MNVNIVKALKLTEFLIIDEQTNCQLKLLFKVMIEK